MLRLEMAARVVTPACHPQKDRSKGQSLDRITVDPAVAHGKCVIRGMRYPVETLLESLSSGMTFDEILADYEDLERDDLLTALTFADHLAG